MFVFAVCAVVSEGKLDRTAVVFIFTEEIPINSADIPGNLVMLTSVYTRCNTIYNVKPVCLALVCTEEFILAICSCLSWQSTHLESRVSRV